MDPTQPPQNPAPQPPNPEFTPQVQPIYSVPVQPAQPAQPIAVPLPPQPQAYVNQQQPLQSPQPSFAQPYPVTATKHSKKPLFIILAVLAVVVIGVVTFVLILLSVVNSATKDAVVVSNQFVADVQANKPDDAYKLTAPGFQQVSSEDDLAQVITESGPSLRGTTKITSKSAVTKGTSKLAVIDYSIANGKTHKYMQIVLQENSSEWQVYTFRARDTPYIGTEGSGVVE